MLDELTKSKILEEEKKHLDDVKEHTHKKVKYIKDYVYNWLFVAVGLNNSERTNINFIDCMCNAGIYQDGTFGTPMEVLELFIEFAEDYPNKNFNLFLNDYNENRIRILCKLINGTSYKQINNIKIFLRNNDVNEYLNEISNYQKVFDNNAMTILFIDPYNFGDVKIPNIINFTSKHYCELIFNYFNSDYRRNIQNNTAKQKQENMISSITDLPGFKEGMNDKEILEVIKANLKNKNINYVFCYTFRVGNGKGIDLYQLLYATPNIKGLKLIKNSLWKIFSGDQYYKSPKISKGQISLFNDVEIEKINVQNYAVEASELLLEKYENQIVSYKEIQEFILENTMLKNSHIINGLLKPLIIEGKIIKKVPSGKRENNYTDSYYQILSE